MNARSVSVRPVMPALLVAALVIAGCGGAGGDSRLRVGAEIPPDEPVVRLATVLQNAAEYDGKRIVLHGVVTNQCGDLCEFVLLDGTETAKIHQQGIKFPKLERGKSVTIYAQVTSGEERVVLSALGLRME